MDSQQFTDYRQIISAAAGFVGLADFFGGEHTKQGTITNLRVEDVGEWNNPEAKRPCLLIEIDGIWIKASNSLMQGLHQKTGSSNFADWQDWGIKVVKSKNRNGTIGIDLIDAIKP